MGSLQYSNLVFSQILALLFTNFIIYLQISLLSLKMVSPAAIIGMSFDNVLCCLIWCGLAIKVYRWLYILAVLIGPFLTVSAVWTIADIFNGLMAIPNLIALLALSGVVAAETKSYFSRLDSGRIRG